MNAPAPDSRAVRRRRAAWLLAVSVGLCGCSHGGAPEGTAGARHDLARGGHTDPDGPGDQGAPPDLTAPSEPDWTKLAAYLDSLFNMNKSLLREYPGATSYWTAPDNGLGARAYQYLPTPNLARRDVILNALLSYKICGCDDVSEHEAVINHFIDPLVTKNAQIPLTPMSACARQPVQTPSPTGQCGSLDNSCSGSSVLHQDHSEGGWLGDGCNFGICNTNSLSGWDGSGAGKGLGDALALQILSRKNRGTDAASLDALWQNLVGKWDGKGINDQATKRDGNYTTAKVAYLKIAARVLGKPLPAGVDEKLKESQGTNGGIRTTYKLDGTFTLDQQGNAETTSLVVLAYRKPVADF